MSGPYCVDMSRPAPEAQAAVLLARLGAANASVVKTRPGAANYSVMEICSCAAQASIVQTCPDQHSILLSRQGKFQLCPLWCRYPPGAAQAPMV